MEIWKYKTISSVTSQHLNLFPSFTTKIGIFALMSGFGKLKGKIVCSSFCVVNTNFYQCLLIVFFFNFTI